MLGKRLLLFMVALMFGFSTLAAELFLAKDGGKSSPAPQLDRLGFPTNTSQAFALGQADARHDLTTGLMQWKRSGLPKPNGFAFVKLLGK